MYVARYAKGHTTHDRTCSLLRSKSSCSFLEGQVRSPSAQERNSLVVGWEERENKWMDVCDSAGKLSRS